MKLHNVFTDTVVLYVKKMWVHTLFSMVVTTSVFVQFQLLCSGKFRIFSFALLMFFASLFVFSLFFLVANILKVHTSKPLLLLCFKWIAVVVGCDLIYQYILKSIYITDWLSYLIGTSMLWALIGIITISLCHTIKKQQSAEENITKNNIQVLTKGALYFFAIAFVFVFAALAMAHPSKIAQTVLPPEKIAQNEQIFFWLAVLILVPLYVLFLTQLYETSAKDKEKE